MRPGSGKRLLAVVCVAVLGVGHAIAADLPVVKTETGKVRGALTMDGKVVAFKGIPYAAPPIGDLRWKPPQAAAKWKGVRDATNFGAHCEQSVTYADMVFHDPGASEDCLTLNVWAPAGAKKGSLPVMVWIYGGGFLAGGTSEARQDGQYLAHRDVVIVSMNYRLGIFGFFVHPELTSESPHHASGDYGLLDQVAALEWVKRNIAAFGGDPKNVTIFGESAGSFSVSTMMATPLTQGLFTKAIGESGGAFRGGALGYLPREEREKTDAEFAQAAFGTSKLADLRKLSADELLKAVTSRTGPPVPHFAPDVDGYLLPEPVPAIYAEGKQAHVPLLAGWNSDEGRGQVVQAKEPMTLDRFKEQAQRDFGDNAERFLSVYKADNDEQAVNAASDFAGDRFIAYSTWQWISAQVKTGERPVYRYFFDLGSPGDAHHAAILGAFHSDDIEYVFGTLDSRPGAAWRPEDRKASEMMGAYWTNFAKTGDPNAPGLPQWPVYDEAGGWQVMHLNGEPAAKPDDKRQRYLFLDEVWSTDQNKD